MQSVNADLALDNTFDSDGLAFVNFTPQLDSARDIAVQPADGKLVLVGLSREDVGGGDTYDRVGLTRLNTNGSLDTGFGTNGLVTTQPGTPSPYGGADGRAVAIQDDGKIIVAGSYNVNDGSGPVLLVVRYLDTGTPDASFDGDGIVMLGQATVGESVAIQQTDGKIVVAGTAQPFPPSRVGMVARLTATGALDMDFATNGFYYAEGPNGHGATDFKALTISGDGRIVAGGPGDGDLFVVRLSDSGVPDATFGGDGKVAINVATEEPAPGIFVGTNDELHGLTVLGSGKIVVTGSVGYFSGARTLLARLTDAGALDTAFGTGGYAPFDGITANQLAYDLVALTDGSFVVAGLVKPIQVDATGKYAAALTGNTGVQSINGLAVGDGKVVGGGERSAGGLNYEFAALRLTATSVGPSVIDGTSGPDNLFGTPGNDIIDGKGGADVMAGLAGNDTYNVQDPGDTAVEGSNEGSDTVRSSVTYTLPNHVENLISTGSVAINGTGNSLNNALTGNSANNVLNGKAGADTMSGKAGNDAYYVNDSGDKVTEGVDQGTDTVRSSVTHTLRSNVENLVLTGTGAINGTGNTLNNKLTGNSANNILNGGLGTDTLTGGAGQDRFLFNTALGSGNIDKITDFNPADDTIRLENAVFAALTSTGTLAASAFRIGAAAGDASDRILYDPATGYLRYDADGAGGTAAVRFATLTTKPALTRADFVVQ